MRIEFGFDGADSLGRHHSQAPHSFVHKKRSLAREQQKAVRDGRLAFDRSDLCSSGKEFAARCFDRGHRVRGW
jgi:hypothetical protein